MQVGVYYNNNDVRVEDRPRPEIGPGELLVRVRSSGICGSDVMEWYRIKRAPLVLGHEMAGEIAEVGEGVKNYKVGERVFVSHHVPCNTCHYCLHGQHTACEVLHTTNYFPGGFSEYIRVPKVNVESGVLVLPEEVSFEEGTFIEPLACVVRAQRIAQLQSGQSVFILGSGISGLLHLLLARVQGAGRIVITDINEFRLGLAQKLGADRVVSADKDVIGQFKEVNDNRLADSVIVCTSNIRAFNQALQAVGRGGTILCFAPTEPGVNLAIPVNDFWRSNIKIIHSYGAGPQDLKEALELLRLRKVSVKELITHRLKLKDIALGFKLVAEAKDCIKVIIEP